MRILFICLSTLKFNTNTPLHEPLGGTESAIAYLAPELVKLGHSVTLMANCEGHIRDGVAHTPVSEDIAPFDADVIIVTSAPQAMPAIKRASPRSKLILWNHMQPDQPAMLHMFQPVAREAIDSIVYVSEGQRETFAKLAPSSPLEKANLKLDGEGTTVINNAIAPCFENMFTSATQILEEKKCRGVYTSTPYRGLAILSQIKELPIEVYSSMRVYQGDDAVFEPMYESLKKNDCLTMHGSVSQKKLMEALRPLAFLVYPSIFQECHSITLIESMAAGLKVITTDLASPTTEYIDAMSATGGSVADYAKMLRQNINFFRSRPEEWAEKMWQQVQYVNREFTWKKKAAGWDAHFHFLCKNSNAA